MKNKKEYIVKMFTHLLLGVFLFAITPFSIFHQHEEPVALAKELHCTHKIHVSTQKDNCLVCKAHFEKIFVLSEDTWVLIPSTQLFKFVDFFEQDVQIDLTHPNLRGPPSLS